MTTVRATCTGGALGTDMTAKLDMIIPAESLGVERFRNPMEILKSPTVAVLIVRRVNYCNPALPHTSARVVFGVHGWFPEPTLQASVCYLWQLMPQ
jgi:hypothetical protein